MKLEIRNLSFAYKNKSLLDNVDMDICSGNAIGIVGNNGCGKTTLLKIIGGFLKPNSGSISSENKKYKCAGILENPSLWNNMSGRENLIYYLRNSYDEKRALEYAETFEIIDAIDKKVKMYSLGMRQKLALIIAFLSDADLLLFDEPTNSLDKKSTDTFFEFVDKAKQENKAVIIVTHILYELGKNCSEVYLLKNGLLSAWTNESDDTVPLLSLDFESDEGLQKAIAMFKPEEMFSISEKRLIVIPNNKKVSEVVRMVSKYDLEGVAKYEKSVRSASGEMRK